MKEKGSSPKVYSPSASSRPVPRCIQKSALDTANDARKNVRISRRQSRTTLETVKRRPGGTAAADGEADGEAASEATGEAADEAAGGGPSEMALVGGGVAGGAGAAGLLSRIPGSGWCIGMSWPCGFSIYA